MSISLKDVKKLWGRAAGRCSKPGCPIDCIKFLSPENSIILGEMAHIIAKQPDGPRGQESGGENSYENLILLCPTHHTEIDKSPEGTYSVKEIHQWKALHEKKVSDSFLSPKYETTKEMAEVVIRLLVQNHSIWESSGTESDEANNNLLSNLVEIWNLRKLDTIVPNNRKIINIIQLNFELFEVDDLSVCYKFIEHAEGFEKNCYERTEGVLQFPNSFEEVIIKYVKQ